MNDDVSSGPFERRTIKPATIHGTYKVLYEEWRGHPTDGEDGWVPVTQAYTLSGRYIGDPEFAKMLADNGIVPELRTPESSVCSIGYRAATVEWFGWSHRAMFGWKAGDIVEHDIQSGDVRVEPLVVPAGYVVKDVADAKRVACAFAESVS